MGVKFLGDAYMAEATRVMNSDDEFLSAIEDLELSMLLRIYGAPDEDEFDYHILIGEGRAEMARGEVDDPDATVRHSYEIAVGLSKGEINQAAAFLTGKLKVSGNVAKLMIAQGALRKLQDAMDAVDVAY